MATDSFVRVPPDSTGKKLFTQQHTVGADIVQAQVMHLADEDNPAFLAAVDESGALYTRFAEGKPQLDSFGKLRTAGATIMGEYAFKEGLLPGMFSARWSGGSAIAHDDINHCAVLSNGTASGDMIAFTSNTYHHYFPGVSQVAMMTVACGDAGKAGLTRRWGYFDATNGYAFAQVNGVFRAQIISDAQTGVPHLICDVAQSAFNIDKLDGTGPSGMNISLTDDNIYWIDIQWLGAGRIRFGTYYQGQRVVCHEYYHDGNGGFPHTTTGSLPICYMQQNTAGTASVSQMRAWCGSVLSEASLDLTMMGRNALRTFSKAINIAAYNASGAEYVYVGSLSPSEAIGNHDNHSIYFPTYLEVMAWDENGNDARCEVEVYVDPVLTGTSYAHVEPLDPACSVEYDTVGTLFGGGTHQMATYLKGYSHRDLTNAYKSMHAASFKNYAEGGGTRVGTIGGITTSVNGSTPAAVTFVEAQSPLREGRPITIAGVGGMTQINGATVYLKMTGMNTAQLFTDAALTTPYSTFGYSAYTSGGTATGLFGGRLVFAIVCKPMPTTSTTLNVRVNMGWKEIAQ